MLLTVSRALTTAAMAALLGAGLAGASATSASADTIKTRCSDEGCYRVRCNDFGFDCVNIGYEEHYIYRPYRSRWVCDADGERCHWARYYGYDRDTYDEDY